MNIAQTFSLACIDARCEEYGQRQSVSNHEAFTLQMARETRYCWKCSGPMVLIEPMVTDRLAAPRAR